jgi:hypothetical protein
MRLQHLQRFGQGRDRERDAQREEQNREDFVQDQVMKKMQLTAKKNDGKRLVRDYLGVNMPQRQRDQLKREAEELHHQPGKAKKAKRASQKQVTLNKQGGPGSKPKVQNPWAAQ